jgi:hypothetical protein
MKVVSRPDRSRLRIGIIPRQHFYGSDRAFDDAFDRDRDMGRIVLGNLIGVVFAPGKDLDRLAADFAAGEIDE